MIKIFKIRKGSSNIIIKALFTLHTVVDYCTTRGSPMYMAALDAFKAFDRVNHYDLFCK